MLRKGRILRMQARDQNESAAGNLATEAPVRSGMQGLEESSLQTALERKPEVQPPADFARRVALQAAVQPQSRLSHTGSYARLTAVVTLVLVACTLFVLAPRGQASFSNFVFDLELAILVQLALLAGWLGTQGGRER